MAQPSNIFRTGSVKPALVDNTIPAYNFSFTTTEEKSESLRAMSVFAEEPITDEAKLTKVKAKIDKSFKAMRDGSYISDKAVEKPTELTLLQKLSDNVDSLSSTCDAINGFSINGLIDDLLGDLGFGNLFKDLLGNFDGLDGLMDKFNIFGDLLDCAAALTTKGQAVVKDALPVIAGQGGINGYASAITKYGGSNIANLSGSVSTLSGNMNQSLENVAAFQSMTSGLADDSFSSFGLVGTTSNGFGLSSITDMADDLKAQSPIGTLLDVADLKTEMMDGPSIVNFTNKGGSLMPALFPDEPMQTSIQMGRAAMGEQVIDLGYDRLKLNSSI